jgi:hypothetical protein
MEKLGRLVLYLILFALLVYFIPRRASAIGGASNDTYTAETFIPENGSINTTAGTIYTFNLTTQDKTYRWVGLWGNVTGSIQLRTAANQFYTWTLSTVTANSVLYATTDASGVDPTSFALTNNTHLDQADTAYGYAGTVTDRIENTYTTSATFQSPSMETGIVCNTTTLESTWVNYFIRKTSSNIATTDDIVWAVEIEPGGTAFNSQKADYELLVPENEEVGDGEGIGTIYYLWIELN